MKLNKHHIFILCLLGIVLNGFAIIEQKPDAKRTFDPNFKERYSGNKYNYEGTAIVTKTPSGSGNYEDYKDKNLNDKEVDDNSILSINLGPLSWLFYIAIFAAIIYLVYILFNEGGSGLFSSKQNKKIENTFEITTENIESSDIDSLITQAEKENNYRLAIRYYYLLVLKTLSLKNHIRIEEDKTNADYLNETRSKTFSHEFEYTCYLYNYIWYGEFPLSLEKYLKAKSNFVTLLNEVK